jgi:hypothetical protein
VVALLSPPSQKGQQFSPAYYCATFNERFPMATNSTIPPLPNPFTPLAFLPPDIADQLQAEIYVFMAVLSAFIWDWLMSIPKEIEMCRKRKVSLAVVVYFLSRIGTLTNGAMIIVLLGWCALSSTAVSY